jgi:hypothetical protein
VIIWINGPFGVGKTAVTTHLLQVRPSLAAFDTEQIGVLLRGTMQSRIPVTDFQDWVSWRRLVVAALDEISAELGCDVVVPQTVVVERYWHEIAAGLSQRSVALRAFTLNVAHGEHEQRIQSDHLDAEAAGWRRERRSVFDAALPWLGNTTTVLDTTGKSPREVADTIDRHLPTKPLDIPSEDASPTPRSPE